MTNHKQRRVARYKSRGLLAKAAIAGCSSNNRSRRARGKMRLRYWKWAPNGQRFAQACVTALASYNVSR